MIPVIKWPPTCAWDHTATGIDKIVPTGVMESNCDNSAYEDRRFLGFDMVQFGR